MTGVIEIDDCPTHDLTTMDMILQGDVSVLISITELGDGSLEFFVEVPDEGGSIADLRGLFFDFADASIIDSLSVQGADITGSAFGDESILDLGHGMNMNGEASSETGAFDGGISFGTPGAGADDIQGLTFSLTSDARDLTIDDFSGQTFGARLTSVSEIDGDREDSIKLVDTAPEIYYCDDDAEGSEAGAEAGYAGILASDAEVLPQTDNNEQDDPEPPEADCEFVVEGDVNVSVSMTELEDGNMKFDLKVLGDEGDVGDLRGLFFNFGDESLLGGLSVEGEDVTGEKFEADGVTDLGNGVNMKGDGVNDNGAFDGGVSFGTPGIGADDIQETSFILSHEDVALTVDDFAGQPFGLRLTSVGEEDGEREESVKLLGSCPEDEKDPDDCEEPKDDIWSALLNTDETQDDENCDKTYGEDEEEEDDMYLELM
ncbi:MAG: hypothetical protein KUG74_03065 [Rhodobacteraceae bacterium]|nr:hypothetical protein [Paracoccaceae bacterium]